MSTRSFSTAIDKKLIGKSYIDALIEWERENNMPITKERFIFESFSIQYPEPAKLMNYESLCSLVSINKSIKLWLAQKNDEWRLISLQPDWMKGRVKAEEYAKASKLLAEAKDAAAKHSLKVSEMARRMRDEQLASEKQRDEIIEQSLRNDLVFITNIDIQNLTIEDQLAYMRASFMEDEVSKAKEVNRLKLKVRDMQEQALSAYLAGKFDRSKYQRSL